MSTSAVSPAYAAAHLSPLNAAAHKLGLIGLLPFGIGALLSLIVRDDAHPFVVLALSAYAAVVVAFLGAIHWGVGMASPAGTPQSFGWSVVPALVAWIAVIMPPSAGLVVEGVMLIVTYLVDRRLYPQHGLAFWLTLRFRLTVVATLCCFIAALRT